MSISSWVDDRVKTALEELVPLLISESGPITQNIVNAVVQALSAQITSQIGGLPVEVSNLLVGEINKIPQQVNELLDVPAAVAGAMTNLPEQIANAIKGLFPFPL